MHHRLAVVFPGQGSQAVGMFSPWADDAVFRDTVAEASEAVAVDLWALAQQGPPDRLADTRLTQPLMVAAGVAVWRAWRHAGGTLPHCAAGHSVGEITALVAADALDLRTGMQLVQARARAMAQAVPPGVAGMAAVLGLADEAVARLCAECTRGHTGEVLEPANFNAEGQVVVAGHASALERLPALAEAAGAKTVIRLPVSGPFHSSLMAPAAPLFGQALQDAFAATAPRAPRFHVLHNVNVMPAQPATLGPRLVAHLTHPVRWSATVRRFVDEGVTHIVEMGPGEVLTNLGKRITARVRPAPALAAACTPEALRRALASLPVPAGGRQLAPLA